MVAVVPILAAVVLAWAADWPQWGGSGSRNMVSTEKGLPSAFGPGNNLRWEARLGTQAFGSPVVAGGKVFVGTTNRPTYDTRRTMWGGAELCFDEKTGRLLWQLVIPQLNAKGKIYNLGHYCYGVCSTAAVEGNRVYLVSSRDEVLCLDTLGQANGNDGPFKDESRYMSDPYHPPLPLRRTDADIIWRLDMMADKDIDAFPHDAADCSVLILGNYLYVSPGNGVDRNHSYIPRPKAAGLIVVDKRSGKVLARERTTMGKNVLHGEWSSASTGVVGGRSLVFYGGGDGVCYAFDARPKPPSRGQRIGTLKEVWRFDVNAAAGRGGKYGEKDGPSEIIATPVFYKNRAYVAIGQDPTHGKGSGALACIDATKTGDITRSGKVWLFKDIERSLSTVAVSGGLLYATDVSGTVFCIDADTGRLYWKHDTHQETLASPLAADGKVYVGTMSGDLWVFAAGKTRRLLRTVHVGSAIAATPAAADGTLFVATQSRLYAAAIGKNFSGRCRPAARQTIAIKTTAALTLWTAAPLFPDR